MSIHDTGNWRRVISSLRKRRVLCYLAVPFLSGEGILMDHATFCEEAPLTVGIVASSALSQPAGPAQLSPDEPQGKAGGYRCPQPYLDRQPYFLRDHRLLLRPQRREQSRFSSSCSDPISQSHPLGNLPRSLGSLYLRLVLSEDPSLISLCMCTDRTHT